MKIKELKKRHGLELSKKGRKTYTQFEELLTALQKRDLPEDVIRSINIGIERINSTTATEKEWRRQIRKTQADILKLIEKKLNLVTKNHYRNMWMAVGMAAFGIPLGVAFGTTQGNMAMLGIGMPIGMVIGMAVGAAKDKKAYQSNNQIDMEIKY